MYLMYNDISLFYELFLGYKQFKQVFLHFKSSLIWRIVNYIIIDFCDWPDSLCFLIKIKFYIFNNILSVINKLLNYIIHLNMCNIIFLQLLHYSLLLSNIDYCCVGRYLLYFYIMIFKQLFLNSNCKNRTDFVCTLFTCGKLSFIVGTYIIYESIHWTIEIYKNN